MPRSYFTFDVIWSLFEGHLLHWPWPSDYLYIFVAYGKRYAKLDIIGQYKPQTYHLSADRIRICRRFISHKAHPNISPDLGRKVDDTTHNKLRAYGARSPDSNSGLATISDIGYLKLSIHLWLKWNHNNSTLHTSNFNLIWHIYCVAREA